MFSESITHPGFGTASTLEQLSALDRYLIKDEDVENLKKFWNLMIKHIPKNFYDVTNADVNHINIAYKRYCDALVERGIEEKRVTSAVMGLESLFLKREENQELTYRLKMRIARLLSKLEFDPTKVKKIIIDTYNVRSIYVQGGILSYEDKVDLENKYESINKLFRLILNYLRISILIMIFIRMGKVEFLDLIDNSMIDKEKAAQLENVISNIKNLIPINQ